MCQGSLKIQLSVADGALHGSRATVLILQNGAILHTLETDINGMTEPIMLGCPSITPDIHQAGGPVFETYDVVVPAANGFMETRIYGVQIFDGIDSVLTVNLEPYVEGGSPDMEIVIPREHGVDIDRDNSQPGNYPPDEGPEQRGLDFLPIDQPVVNIDPFILDPAPLNVPLVNEVVVPEQITVHLGAPNVNARQIHVPFKD